MALVNIVDDDLVVVIEGLDKLWALTSRLVVPLRCVRGATADPGAIKEPKGIRGPGTHLPGFITAGTFRIDGERIFWDVHNPAKAVVIELADQRFARLVIEVADPAATVALIEHATSPR